MAELNSDPLLAILIKNYLDRSLEAIQSVGFIQPEERAQVEVIYKESLFKERPYDVLEALAVMRHGDNRDANFQAIIRDLSYLLANSIYPIPVLIPFAVKMVPPVQFYEMNPKIAQAAKNLMVPVLFNEDNESFGIISTNPIATELLKEEIETHFLSQRGVLPYVSCFRADYTDWVSMISKHFEL